MTTQRQPENKQYIIDAIDQAISAAFNENFRTIAQDKTEDEIRSIFSLRIAQLIPNPQNPPPKVEAPAPDNDPPALIYDEAAALIYAVACQLQHINLTYSLITALQNRQNPQNPALTQTGQLHIIDLTPHALAMQFGITLAVADALKAGQNITSVTLSYTAADTPLPLLGKTIWQNFTATIQSEISAQNRQFQWLYRACNLIHPSPRNSLAQIPPTPDSDTWLTAIYPANENPETSLPPDLDQLVEKTKPDAAILTRYGNHATTDAPTPEIIAPFTPENYNITQLSGAPRPTTRPAIPNRLGHYFAEKVTNLNKLFRLINNRQISPRTEAAILNWPPDTTSLICTAKPVPTPAPAAPAPLPPTPAATPPAPEPPADLAVGDRVQTPIGTGQIWRIRKARADVRLDNGISTTVPVPDLKPAQQ